jgi:hypothetical protein
MIAQCTNYDYEYKQMNNPFSRFSSAPAEQYCGYPTSEVNAENPIEHYFCEANSVVEAPQNAKRTLQSQIFS